MAGRRCPLTHRSSALGLVPCPTVQHYKARLLWRGSTGLGWEAYDREHEVTAPPAEAPLRLTTGEEKGDPRVLNPEQLVVAAASSCQLLWFLHLAAKARIDVVEYRDDAEAEMPLGDEPVWLARIVLRPRITVRGAVSEERVARLCEIAHEHCYIANSLRSDVVVEPQNSRRTTD
jgi:organic hydroperoxide reductase OsmC/OhrA